MWAALSRKSQILIAVAAAVVAAWAIDALLDWWTGKDGTILGRISLAATIVGAALMPIAEKAWRPIWRLVPPLARWIFPDLTGRWEGTLTSAWVDPETKESPPPIPTRITIRQSLFSTVVTLRTDETPLSRSTRTFLEVEPETGQWRIWYSYDNEPKPEVRHRSSPHKGVAWLEYAPDNDPSELTGQYYTDRMTAGSIRVRRKSAEA